MKPQESLNWMSDWYWLLEWVEKRQYPEKYSSTPPETLSLNFDLSLKNIAPPLNGVEHAYIWSQKQKKKTVKIDVVFEDSFKSLIIEDHSSLSRSLFKANFH